MKRLFFGNPNTDYIEFQLEDLSRAESVICLKGNLAAGFFEAHLYLYIDPTRLAVFLADLDRLDKALDGRAQITAEGPQNVVEIILSALKHGHIECRGTAAINGNSLSFRFETDQTQLTPMHRWFSTVLEKYNGLQ
jgi:hypothetical protein